MTIPKIKIAVIGGSTLIDSNFPKSYENVEVIKSEIKYDTPFDPSAPFCHAKILGTEFLFVPFHGITKEIKNTEPNSAGERVFYVLLKAGVERIIGTALCGSTNRLLDPADVLVPDDFVDYTTKRPQAFIRNLIEKGEKIKTISYRLHKPFCPTLSAILVKGALNAGFPRVFSRGVVGVSEGPRLESSSEIQLRYTNQGIDVVTMNLVPEVYFAREIGACYSALELVSNYGEGIINTRWKGAETFKDFQEKWRRPTAEAILYTIKSLDVSSINCECSTYRWNSIFS